MIGLLARKNSYYYTAKWRSNEDRSETDYFRFKIRRSDDTYNTDLNNMEGTEGLMEIETTSGLRFMIDDFVYFRGMRFNIVKLDSDMTKIDEQAFSKFNFNGGLITVLSLRKAGND